MAASFDEIQRLCNSYAFLYLTLIFQYTYTVAPLIIRKVIDDSNDTHYIMHNSTNSTFSPGMSTLDIQLDFCGVYCTTALLSHAQTDKVLVLQSKFVSDSALTCTLVLQAAKLKHFLFNYRFSLLLMLVSSSKYCLMMRLNNRLNRGILLGNGSTPHDIHLLQVSSSTSLWKEDTSSHRWRLFIKQSNLILLNNFAAIAYIQQTWCHDLGVCFTMYWKSIFPGYELCCFPYGSISRNQPPVVKKSVQDFMFPYWEKKKKTKQSSLLFVSSVKIFPTRSRACSGDTE